MFSLSSHLLTPPLKSPTAANDCHQSEWACQAYTHSILIHCKDFFPSMFVKRQGGPASRMHQLVPPCNKLRPSSTLSFWRSTLLHCLRSFPSSFIWAHEKNHHKSAQDSERTIVAYGWRCSGRQSKKVGLWKAVDQQMAASTRTCWQTYIYRAKLIDRLALGLMCACSAILMIK